MFYKVFKKQEEEEMNKLLLLFIAGIFLISFISAKDLPNLSSVDITDFSKTTYETKGISIVPMLTKNYSMPDIKWVENGTSFYPETKIGLWDYVLIFFNLKSIPNTNLTEFHWLVNKLETSQTCKPINQYASECSKEVLDFSKFESKNVIFNKTIKENKDKNGTIISYLISFYGLITDLDPTLLQVYTNGNTLVFKNITEGTTSGARLHAPVLFMDFNKAPENLTNNEYVQDNSVYNNYGTRGNGNDIAYPTYNSSCTAFSGSGGCYEFDGVNDYIGYTTGLQTSQSWWYKSSSGSWTHYANSSNTFYINGAVNTSKVIFIMNTTAIGRNSTGYINGSIDDVRIWDRALSSNEIATLYADATSQGKYAKSGDFKSLVFYNSTSQYWNTTFAMANSSGQGVDLTDVNLVSYWKLDENYKDSKGTNHGTPSGTNNATGLSSDAMRFDGVDDWINVTDSDSLDLGTEISICAWIKSSLTGSYPIIISKCVSASDRYELFLHSGYNYKVGFVVSATAVNSTSVPTANSWNYICVSYNGSFANFYLNGASDGSSATNITNSGGDGANLAIGDRTNGGGNPFNGLIDEVLIYNDILTPTEIYNLYKTGLSQHASTNISLQTRTASSYNLTDTGLVSQWSFNTNESGNASDGMGRNNGTCSGTACPTWNESYGTVGAGYNFDGGDYINVTDIDALDGVTTMTISAWIKQNSLGVNRAILAKWDYQTQGSWAIQTHGISADEIQIFIANALDDIGVVHGVTTNADLVANKWYHLVMVYNGSGSGNADKLKYYVDGIEKAFSFTGTIPTALTSASSTVKIGMFGGSLTRYFNGSIDEVRIYNRSLSASEVSDLYEMGSSVFSDWGSWSGYSKMNDLVANKSNTFGNFFQFKSYFESNNTEVSPYLINHSVLFGGYGDTTPPYFTYIPADESVTYPNNWNGVYFTATDNFGISSWAVNTTNFTINSTGYLDNNGNLTAGGYSINITITDIGSNINYTIYNFTINQNTGSCSVYFNSTSPLVYPTAFTSYTDCLGSTLYRNGTSITNNSIQDLTVGYYNFSVIRTDSVNYSNIYDEETFTINKGTPTLTLSSSAGWTVPSATNSTITGSNCPTQLICYLYENGVNVSNPFIDLFSAGSYYFVYNTTGNTNYTSDSESNTLNSQVNYTSISNVTSFCVKNRFGYNYLNNQKMVVCE